MSYSLILNTRDASIVTRARGEAKRIVDGLHFGVGVVWYWVSQEIDSATADRGEPGQPDRTGKVTTMSDSQVYAKLAKAIDAGKECRGVTVSGTRIRILSVRAGRGVFFSMADGSVSVLPAWRVARAWVA